MMKEESTDGPTVYVDGKDLRAYHVEYFDDSEGADIAVSPKVDEFHSGGGNGACGEWVHIPAGEDMAFCHVERDVTGTVSLTAVQIEEKSPLLWFDWV
jgi:hypothetical protein